MSRFCTKKEMPCHQQGKQEGKSVWDEAVVPVPVTMAVVVLSMGMSGTVEVSVVTAARGKCSKCTHIT
jgi:hypothetical protein